MRKIPVQKIFSILSELEGSVGLYVKDCATGEEFSVNGRKIFPCASVIKVPMLALLLKDAAEGRVNLSERRKIAPANRVGGTGILRELSPDYEPSIEEMAKLMIIMSDNIATNEIMDILTPERFNGFCISQGYDSIIWERKMMDLEALKQGRNNYMNAEDTGRLLARVAEGDLVSREACEKIFAFMCGQRLRSKLPARVPAVASYVDESEVPEGKVLVGNKTGDLVCIQHDVGIFQLPDGSRYVIAMFTSDLKTDQEGIDAIARVSEAVYEGLKRQ